MERYSFCPECSIGLNSMEMELCFCQNCKADWECKNCCNENLYKEDKIINLVDGFYCTGCLWYDGDRKELRLHKHYH